MLTAVSILFLFLFLFLSQVGPDGRLTRFEQRPEFLHLSLAGGGTRRANHAASATIASY
jgi:hypothetical protein